ncbi:MAG: hemolysin III family protein [Holophagaceae bacterium]|uniref:Hemolysin III family protein n=1 Tax=Candidatus Geothrix skivensis TaxID=2954439 RepID=A0A9D7SEN8_9BACT|nr:hemolysin III family protein [Candidatus Geothrix skivensis]
MSRTASITGLPTQTRGEELANSLTHGLGTALSIAGLVLMVVFAARNGTARDVVGGAIFGSSLILLYLMSTLYHAFRGPRVKLVFKIFDHSAIFMLIAGTYTPFCLSALGRQRPGWGWTLFGLIWGLAVLGIVFKAVFYARLAKQIFRAPAVDHLHALPTDTDMDPVFVKRMGWISTTIYLLMGWLIVVPILGALLGGLPLQKILSLHGAYWLFGGGLFYSLGAAIYSLEKLRYHHALWHLFVIGGSACHVFAVLFHVIPGK